MRRITCELLQMMPSISFETVMEFTWMELKAWHETAFEVFKNMRGVG
jgi:hypothetical protein